MTSPDDTAHVTRDDSRGRFEISIDGVVIGSTYFVPTRTSDAPERIFYHTEIDDSQSGQGRASQLVSAAMDDSAQADLTVVPVCPSVKRWLEKHPEHPVTRARVTPDHLRRLPRVG